MKIFELSIQGGYFYENFRIINPIIRIGLIIPFVPLIVMGYLIRGL